MIFRQLHQSFVLECLMFTDGTWAPLLCLADTDMLENLKADI